MTPVQLRGHEWYCDGWALALLINVPKSPACFTSLYLRWWWWLWWWWVTVYCWLVVDPRPCSSLYHPPPPFASLWFLSPPRSFSRLFSPSSSFTAVMKKAESQGREVKYTPPAGGGMKKRSSTFSQFPTEKSKAFDFLNEEWVVTQHSFCHVLVLL